MLNPVQGSLVFWMSYYLGIALNQVKNFFTLWGDLQWVVRGFKVSSQEYSYLRKYWNNDIPITLEIIYYSASNYFNNIETKSTVLYLNLNHFFVLFTRKIWLDSRGQRQSWRPRARHPLKRPPRQSSRRHKGRSLHACRHTLLQTLIKWK